MVHSLSALRLTLLYEGWGLPAIPFRNFGMRTALGNVGKTGEIDRVSLVVHVGLENVVVPAFPGWSVLQVMLIVVEARRRGQCSAEVGQPFVEIRVHDDVWRREDHMFHAPWEWRRKQTDVPVLVLLALVARRNDGAHPSRNPWTGQCNSNLYALFLLAQFRETSAYPLVVRFASLPGDILDS